MVSLLRAGLGVIFLGGLAISGGIVLQILFASSPSPKSLSQKPQETIANIESIAPEPPDAFDISDQKSKEIYGHDFMMVAAHPAAAHIGAAILNDGGSAVDAIIAAQMVLNLVEPQSSGIGGGGFLLVWDKEEGQLTSYDGRETAPAKGTAEYLRDENGKFRSFMDVVAGGASVGVPGLLGMLEMAHQEHGIFPWASLFDPAIKISHEGFPISPRLNKLLQSAKHLNSFDVAASYFYESKGGAAWPVGHILKNPHYADTLRQIAEGGADAFYTGPLAEAMVRAVQSDTRNPGTLSLKDLANYQAKKRKNLCLSYRFYQICGMAPPSSGGSTVLQIMGLLHHTDAEIAYHAPPSVYGIHMFSEAMRLAFADRNRFIADSDFVNVPLQGLLSPEYLEKRARLMDFSEKEKSPLPSGNPGEDHAFEKFGLDNSPELPSTTHLVAVDRQGNVATMTSSIEQGFGSRIMVGGFLLNNQLTDFAWSAERDGKPVANRYEPGKRPRSSMAPTLVFGPDGQPRLAIGSPGGSRIIGYVAKTLVSVLDWELSIQEAINLPHFLNRNSALELEESLDAETYEEYFKSKGYEVKIRNMASGIHGVEFAGGLLIGGADPRREGLAVSELNLTHDLDAVFKSLIKDHSD